MITKTLLFFTSLVTSHRLYAAKLVNKPYAPTKKVSCMTLSKEKQKLLVYGYCRQYNIPSDRTLLILHFVHDNPLQYKNGPLPNDLSNQDLSGFDFTGCHFSYTNLSNTNLDDVILTNTTCDYQKIFQDSLNYSGAFWYKNNLPKDLKSIAEVYPNLQNNEYKATLLHIACGLSRLVYYDFMKLGTKLAYWSCALLQLKQKLDKSGDQLTCSLENSLNYYLNQYGWKTTYPKNEVNIDAKDSGNNFAQYLKDLDQGLEKWCGVNNPFARCYNKEIISNIESLENTYPKMKDKQLQEKTCHIAHALSKSYQIQDWEFLYHFYFYQNCIVELEEAIKSNRAIDKNNEEEFFGLYHSSLPLSL